MASLLAKAIRYEYPETIPVSVSILPAAWIKYGGELQGLVDKYPQFFNGFHYAPETYRYSPSYHGGSFTDPWGCVWSNIQEGMESIVTGHPVTCEEDIEKLQEPAQLDGRFPHGFLYLRLLDLCGFEQVMMMFAEDSPALQTLIDKVLDYNMKQLDVAIPHMGEVAYFGDDLGMQKGLAMGPQRWRKYIKPAFAAFYGKVKAAKPDTLIFMHTDGCIWEIMQDLQECGVDMVNPQFRANGLNNLVRVCKGRIPIKLDLDRQLFPFGSQEVLRNHVIECVEKLYLPEGGLALNIEFNEDVPLESMATVLETVEEYRHYKK